MSQIPAFPTRPLGRRPFILFLLLAMLLPYGGFARAEMQALPAAFDLRDVGGRAYIGPVKNQGPMGTCYAFGAVAAAESTYNRSMGLYDERAVRFSESFIIWSLSPYYDGFGPYSGANYDYDELQALVDYGLPTEEDFPYATSQPVDLHWDAERVRFGSWHRIPANDIETMKRVLQTFGAIDAAVYVENAFAYHEDGVFSDAYTSPLTAVEYHTPTNHAISLIGWDDDAGEDGQGAWILRNSWGPSWGADGYMLIDYTSAAVATSGTYLVYGDWTGDDFRLENTADIDAVAGYSGHQPVARGIYEWGGNDAFIGNSAQIWAEATVDSGSPHVHGIFLWAGDESAIANGGVVTAEASTADGQATAYGICMQGRDVGNSGEVSAFAGSLSDGRATAYGVRQFGFDDAATFDNTGSILAEARTGGGWAYGYFGNRIGRAVNSGQILANAADLAVGLLAEDTARVVNSGGISAEADGGSAEGILIQGGELVNDGNVWAVGGEKARGMYGTNGVVFSNSGTVSAYSESGRAVGVELRGSTLSNIGDISAETATGTAYGVIAGQGSVVVNNGHVVGDSVIFSGSSLGGNGLFTGDVWNLSGVVAPGNSIGVITIDGDYRQDADGALILEFGGGQHDALEIFGRAYLGGGLRLSLVDYQEGGTYPVLTSNGLEGEFADVTSPAVLSTELSGSPSGLDLILTRNAYASLAADSGQRSVGAALDRFRRDAAGDMGAALLDIDNMELGDLRDALVDMAPGIHAATRRSLVDLSHLETETLLGRMEEQAFRMPGACPDAAADDGVGQWTFWGSVSAAAGAQDAGGVLPGLDTQTANSFLGAEKCGGRWTTGATVSLLNHVMDGNGDANRSEVTSVRGHVHSLWRRHAGEGGPYVAASLGGGRSRIVTARDVTFLDAVAEATHWAHDISLGLGAGHVFAGRGWRILPHARISGLYLHEGAVDEKDAAPLDLDIASEDIFSVHSSVGLRAGRLIRLDGASLFPEARIQWTHSLASDGEDIRARFNGYDPGFAIDSDFTRDRLLLGAGLTLGAKGLHGGLRYEYSANDGGDGEEHHVALKVEFSF